MTTKLAGCWATGGGSAYKRLSLRQPLAHFLIKEKAEQDKIKKEIKRYLKRKSNRPFLSCDFLFYFLKKAMRAGPYT